MNTCSAPGCGSNAEFNGVVCRFHAKHPPKVAQGRPSAPRPKVTKKASKSESDQ